MPFEKGDPNINRNGRPKKGQSWGEILKEIGEEELGNGMSRREAVSRKLWQAASQGQSWAVKELMDRIDGKALQQIISTNDNTINIRREIIDGPPDKV